MQKLRLYNRENRDRWQKQLLLSTLSEEGLKGYAQYVRYIQQSKFRLWSCRMVVG